MPLSAWKAIRKQATDWAREYHPHIEDLDIRALWDRTIKITRSAARPNDKLIVIKGVSETCWHRGVEGGRCAECTRTNKVQLRYESHPYKEGEIRDKYIKKADQFLTDSFPGGVTAEVLGAFLELIVEEDRRAR